MFYVCVALSLFIVYLGKLYLNEKLESQNIKYLHNKEIESLKKSNKELTEQLKDIDEQSWDWRYKYYSQCKINENEFEKKHAENAWLKKIRENKEELERWRSDIIGIRVNDEFLEALRNYVGDIFRNYHFNVESVYFTKVLQTFKEVETLKQELATQVANNIILKDELNKLKQ